MTANELHILNQILERINLMCRHQAEDMDGINALVDTLQKKIEVQDDV
jgi:hypothetical protein